MNLKKLANKFPVEDVEWRIQQSGKSNGGGHWALVIAYITNRAIMQRLDDVVGMGLWQNKFMSSPCNTGYQCGISIKIGAEWVTRWDGAEKSGGSIDNVKTTMSNSMKRTGVQWGIGRYLYNLESGFADVKDCNSRRDVMPGYIFHENKKNNIKFQWKPPTLPAWALPLSKKEIAAGLKCLSEVETLDELRFAWEEAYRMATSENDDELLKKFTQAKDDAKIRIEEQTVKSESEDTAKINTYISKQLLAFDKVPNVVSVTSVKDSLLKELKARTKDTAVDSGPFIIKITEAYQQRIQQLESK